MLHGSQNWLWLYSSLSCPRPSCPRQDSNLRSRFRKPMLYPLSYEGGTSADSSARKSPLSLRLVPAAQVRQCQPPRD